MNESLYWTPQVKRLKPYVPGEQPRDKQYLKLNTNENAYPPSPRVADVLSRYPVDQLRLYPDPQASSLCRAIAQSLAVHEEQVFVGNGSDEVLAFIFKAFFKNGQPLLFPDLSYSFYPVYCNLFDIDSVTVPLREDFSINPQDYAQPAGGVIFPNPNAPTSKYLPLQSVETIARLHMQKVVVIDEAYIDFGGDSAISLLGELPNILITRTFSKCASLAGMRIGYAVGSPELVEALRRVKDSFNSYPVDALAQAAAEAAVLDTEYVKKICATIIATRDQCAAELAELGFTMPQSSANFLFVTHPQFSGSQLHAALREHGILVRHWNSPRIADYVRISVGTESEMRQLVESLRTIIATGPAKPD